MTRLTVFKDQPTKHMIRLTAKALTLVVTLLYLTNQFIWQDKTL